MAMGAPLQDPQMMPVQYDMPTQYGQYDMPTQYGLPPETQWPPMPPSYEQPLDMQFASPELQPTQNVGQKDVADLGLKPLQLGQVVCSQAMTGQWWTAEVFHDNMDYTYFLLIQDDVQTQWPRVHWADILDKSCSDFYQAELDKDEGQQQQELQPEQHQEFHQDPHQELQQQQQQQEFQHDQDQELQIQDQDLPPQDLPQELQDQKETGRWSAAKKKKRPWGVISAAAVAGSVPILYHLTGAAGPAA